METIDRTMIEKLVAHEESWCVSLLMPTHEVVGHGTGDRIALQNLIAEARRQLRELEVEEHQIETIVGGLDVSDAFDPTSEVFHRGGVAVYASPSVNAAFHITVPVQAAVFVKRRFHVLPLIEELTLSVPHHVLTLSRGNVALFSRSAAGRLHRVEVPDLPNSLEEATAFDDREPVLSSHSGSSRGGNAATAVFHGQGDRGDALDEDVLRLLRAVDRAITPIVGDDLVILAGNAKLGDSLRRMTTNVVAADGLPDLSDDVSDLERRARDVAISEVVIGRENVLRDVAAKAGTGLVELDPDAIQRASEAKRISTLVVTRSAAVPQDVEGLDRLVASVRTSGGEVVVAETGTLPDEQPVAALLRW